MRSVPPRLERGRRFAPAGLGKAPARHRCRQGGGSKGRLRGRSLRVVSLVGSTCGIGPISALITLSGKVALQDKRCVQQPFTVYSRIKKSPFARSPILQRWGCSSLGLLLWGVVFHPDCAGIAENQSARGAGQRQLSHLNSAVAQQTPASALRRDHTFASSTLPSGESDDRPPPRCALHRAREHAAEIFAGLTDIRMSHHAATFITARADGRRSPAFRKGQSSRSLPRAPESFISANRYTAASPARWENTDFVGLARRRRHTGDGRIDRARTRCSCCTRRWRLKPAGSIMLLNSRGVILSRTPYEQSLIGKRHQPRAQTSRLRTA